MTEEEKNNIEDFINNTDYFNIDISLKEIYREQYTGNHIPRID